MRLKLNVRRSIKKELCDGKLITMAELCLLFVTFTLFEKTVLLIICKILSNTLIWPLNFTVSVFIHHVLVLSFLYLLYLAIVIFTVLFQDS